MLRLAEEIMLLLLDEAGGAFDRMPALQRDHALAGAVLLDLTLESRIDTDPTRLFVLDPAPVGDDLLDPLLVRIAQSSETHDAGYWVRQAVRQANDTFEGSAGRLVGRGILDRKEHRFLGIRRRSRYEVTDAEAAGEPKQRVLRLLSDTDIPDVRDIVLISLADACGILESLLPAREFSSAALRIDQFRNLDPVGRSVSKMLGAIGAALAAFETS